MAFRLLVPFSDGPATFTDRGAAKATQNGMGGRWRIAHGPGRVSWLEHSVEGELGAILWDEKDDAAIRAAFGDWVFRVRGLGVPG